MHSKFLCNFFRPDQLASQRSFLCIVSWSNNNYLARLTLFFEIGFEFFQEGFYLWENIYEKVRTISYKDKPSREKSFFLFDNLKDCQYYMDNHKGGGQICEVEIVETRSLFKADMNLLDIIPNNYTFKQTQEHVEKYWSGKTSDKIVYEYLFQGICKLKPL